MSIWARIASVTNSASLNDSTAKPRLVELSEKRYGMSVDPSLTAMVMTSMPLPLAVFAAAVACVRQFGAANVAQLVDGLTLREAVLRAERERHDRREEHRAEHLCAIRPCLTSERQALTVFLA